MSHKAIILNNIALFLNNKTCFEEFSTQIQTGNRILIIGANGAGKSMLLSIIQGLIPPTSGNIQIPEDIVFGSVPQIVTDYPQLSGGQKFNKALSSELGKNPDILCLDEPTNHLDSHNKQSLIRMLQRWTQTLIIVSHDLDILALDFDEIWTIEHEKIAIFYGNYADYQYEHELSAQANKQEQDKLQKEKRKLNILRQSEYKRTAHSKAANKHENDRVLLNKMKATGEKTTGTLLRKLSKAQSQVQEKLSQTFVHKKIEPTFHINANQLLSRKSIISIVNGSCGYAFPILKDIFFQCNATDKIAILGDNGTGKSTFFKALLQDPSIFIDGQWSMPSKEYIGYLDQYYSTLNPKLNVIEIIQETVPDWNNLKIRKHLNDFLFRTQEEVLNKVSHLSGGERARLSLAQIAAQSPCILLLDEITNNVELDTRLHIIEVLQQYPGAMIIISHDTDFLKELTVETLYEIKNNSLKLKTN